MIKPLSVKQHAERYREVGVARGIAIMAHKGQTYEILLPEVRGVRKQEIRTVPYINHVQQVVNNVSDMTDEPIALAAAWLHDVVEDTPITLKDLETFGLSEAVLFAVACLTRNKVRDVPKDREQYFGYIRRLKSNRYARIVKIADLQANLANRPSEGLAGRYVKALFILMGIEWLAELSLSSAPTPPDMRGYPTPDKE